MQETVFTMTDVLFGCMVGAFLGVLAGIWLCTWWMGVRFSVQAQPTPSQDVADAEELRTQVPHTWGEEARPDNCFCVFKWRPDGKSQREHHADCPVHGVDDYQDRKNEEGGL